MKKYIVILILFVMGVGVYFYKPSQETSKKDEPKISYWVAPMDANYRRDEPGKSPMGMSLIPVYESGIKAGDDDNAVKLSPSVINNLGVRTAKVEKGTFHRQIETVGYVGYNETKIGHVHVRTEGWIERIHVYSIGEEVKKGDLLFEIYSPDILNAQTDYIQALNMNNRSLIKGSEERLQAFGLMKDQISKIKKTGKVDRLVKVFAHHDGFITKLNAAHGMYVKPENMILETADLSTVWLLVDVFETQSSWIKKGLSAEVSLSYEPGRVWKGKIAYVYPQIDPKTRTLKARIEFDNPEEILKPDMYANVSIMGEEMPDTLMIPREALIRTGTSERVILSLGGGRYQPAQVKVGQEGDGNIEILEGLSEGEGIVISAQFLIDSEASLTGTSLRMHSPKTEKTVKKPMVEPEPIWVVGTLDKIIKEDQKLTVTHVPVKALNWPDMTMDFMYSEKVNLSWLKEGMEIHFRIKEQESGAYQIVEIMDMRGM